MFEKENHFFIFYKFPQEIKGFLNPRKTLLTSASHGIHGGCLMSMLGDYFKNYITSSSIFANKKMLQASYIS
jgi:hypothetical protein